jgi:serine/threonine protein kinase
LDLAIFTLPVSYWRRGVVCQFHLTCYPLNNFYQFKGSPPYAAPEVFEGKKYTGPEIDIWVS